jgi:peptidoglycan/xylan/chitin deacetylase (PgdA/CDA1 family)
MRVVALTFHDVPDGRDGPGPGEPFYRISAEEFEALLSELRKLGYRTVSSRHFREWQQGVRTLPERVVVFTFDDGYASHFERVAPLLLRYRFSGTFFVTTDLVGQPGYVTWEQLRKLIFLGMEIGSHGRSHRPLTQLSPEEVAEELSTSKRVLEERLGVPVHALAAPGGFWSAAVAKATRQAGYDAVWVSTIGANGPQTNPLALRRVVVRQPFSVQRIAALVEGRRQAIWLASSQQSLIRLAKRVLGVYWYEQLKRRLVPDA